MNRAEFMRQLESLLQNISPTEREEAIQYYNDYFDDAGPENEQAVIEALGNPAKVAENIKRDIYGSGYGDNIYQRTTNGREVVKYQGPGVKAAAAYAEKKEGMPTWAIVLIVILCVFASPALLGVVGGALGLLTGLIATWFSLIIAFGTVAMALFAVLIVLAVVGVMCLFASPLTGIALIGAGLLCGGIGLLFLMLTVAMAGIATPAICKGIVSLCKSIFSKKEAAA